LYFYCAVSSPTFVWRRAIETIGRRAMRRTLLTCCFEFLPLFGRENTIDLLLGIFVQLFHLGVHRLEHNRHFLFLVGCQVCDIVDHLYRRASPLAATGAATVARATFTVIAWATSTVVASSTVVAHTSCVTVAVGVGLRHQRTVQCDNRTGSNYHDSNDTSLHLFHWTSFPVVAGPHFCPAYLSRPFCSLPVRQEYIESRLTKATKCEEA
jgi:hypothetical protein